MTDNPKSHSDYDHGRAAAGLSAVVIGTTSLQRDRLRHLLAELGAVDQRAAEHLAGLPALIDERCPGLVVIAWSPADPALSERIAAIRQHHAAVPVMVVADAGLSAAHTVDLVHAGATDVFDGMPSSSMFGRRLVLARVRSAGRQSIDDWRSALERMDPLPTLSEYGDALVHEALRRADGRQRGAARLLGVSQQAVSSRLQRRRTSQIE